MSITTGSAASDQLLGIGVHDWIALQRWESDGGALQVGPKTAPSSPPLHG